MQAAYRDNTLGLPKICPAENLESLDAEILKNFMKRYYKPSRITVAAVNTDHDALVRMVEQFFVKESPSWASEMDGVKDVDESIAQYTGGIIKVWSIV